MSLTNLATLLLQLYFAVILFLQLAVLPIVAIAYLRYKNNKKRLT